MLAAVFAAIVLSSSAGAAALRDRFPDLVKSDPPSDHHAPVESGVRVTYLGTNGYLLEARGAAILIDPYFSRMSLGRCALKLHTVARKDLVEQWTKGAPRLDAVLATHGHVDHLFDAPQILKETGAPLYASARSVELAGSMGVRRGQLHAVQPGALFRAGSATVRVLRASHDRVLGKVPFPDPPKNLPPRNVDDWTVGQPLAYLITIGGKRIYLNSGSLPEELPPPGLGPVDLAILGVATPDAVRAFPGELQRLRPRLVLPSHQDDFFRPLSEGFQFLPGSNFPRVRQVAQAEGRELILLDYFQPWTIR